MGSLALILVVKLLRCIVDLCVADLLWKTVVKENTTYASHFLYLGFMIPVGAVRSHSRVKDFKILYAFCQAQDTRHLAPSYWSIKKLKHVWLRNSQYLAPYRCIEPVALDAYLTCMSKFHWCLILLTVNKHKLAFPRCFSFHFFIFSFQVHCTANFL